MDELISSVGLHVAKITAEPRQIVYDTQVVAMMLQPGTIEVGFGRSPMGRFEYAAGGMVLCRRHVNALVRSDEGIWALSFEISDVALREIAEEKNAEVELQSSSRLEDPRIGALMAAANAERAAGFPSGRLFLESVEMALAAVLVRGYAVARYSLRRNRGGLSPARLRNVTEFIRSQIGEDLSLQKMAEVAGLSVTHFSSMFRESVGESPHQFVLRQRVQHGKELLRAREMRMLDVAMECGFKTQQHFARVFRNMQGASPKEYRRKILH
jgi:AraC family transcriptional regulator